MKQDIIDFIYLIVLYIGFIVQAYIYIYAINPEFTFIVILLTLAIFGFIYMHIQAKYKDNNIPDYMFLDHIVKCFFWIKKSYRQQLLKKNRYRKTNTSNKDTDHAKSSEIILKIFSILFIISFFIIFELKLIK